MQTSTLTLEAVPSDVLKDCFGLLGCKDQSALRAASLHLVEAFDYAVEHNAIGLAVSTSSSSPVSEQAPDDASFPHTGRWAPIDSHHCLQGGTGIGAGIDTLFIDLEAFSQHYIVAAGVLQRCTAKRAIVHSLSSVVVSGFLASSEHLEEVCVRSCGASTAKGVMIMPNFCRGCTKLRTAEFSSMATVHAIADAFLMGCTALQRVSFRGFDSCKRVGASWLDNCRALTDIDFGRFPKLETVGASWLSRCHSLPSVSFASFPRLRQVGFDWLFQAHSLRHFDTTGLEHLTVVGFGWLCKANGIESFRLVEPCSIVAIGPNLLNDCPSLTAADLSAATELPGLTEGLLRCAQLTRLELPRHLKNRPLGEPAPDADVTW